MLCSQNTIAEDMFRYPRSRRAASGLAGVTVLASEASLLKVQNLDFGSCGPGPINAITS